jgi:hypothetical protein
MSGMTMPLQTVRSIWFQQDISTAGWPLLTASTYYWVAVTPTTTLTMPNGRYNGAIWGGIDDTVHPLPAAAQNDPFLFKGRQLTSQCGASDTATSALQASAVTFIQTSENWPSVPCAGERFKNWDLVGSNIRYGIQLIGWQVAPSNPATRSGMALLS